MKIVIRPWRLIWYSILIWLLTFIVSGVVIMPWFYVVMPLMILLATVFYFDKSEPVKSLSLRKIKKHKDNILAVGLIASIFWFLIMAALDFFQLANFYYFNLTYYFSDPRNWLIYPLVLLVPVVYAILLEENMLRKSRRKPFKVGKIRVNS